MLRRLFIHVLLGCLLLLTQQLVLAHGSSHPIKGGLGESQTCHTCLMSAQIGGPLPTCAPDFTSTLRFELTAATPSVTVLPPVIRAFRSRAPPHWL